MKRNDIVKNSADLNYKNCNKSHVNCETLEIANMEAERQAAGYSLQGNQSMLQDNILPIVLHSCDSLGYHNSHM